MAFWYNAHMNTSALCLYAVPNYHCIQCFKGREKPNNPERTCRTEKWEKIFPCLPINETPETLVQYCINV